jgi:copper(I)-binding protein
VRTQLATLTASHAPGHRRRIHEGVDVKASAGIARRVGSAVVVVGAVLTTALSTAGCATGQHAATAEETPAIDAAIGTVGSIALRGVAILAPDTGATSYPQGSNAAMTLVIVNTSTRPDTLSSISSPAATSWVLLDGNTTLLPVAPSSATSTGPPVVGAVPPQVVTIPPGRSVSFALPSSTQSLFLTGLKQQLYTASSVPVTFTFQSAGAITVTVPVQLTPTPGSSTLPAPSGAPE